MLGDKIEDIYRQAAVKTKKGIHFVEHKNLRDGR